jgi:hypothetical protein
MLGGEFSPAVPGKAMGQIAFSTNSSTGNSLSGVATPVGSFPVGPLINKQLPPNRSAVISSDFFGTTIFNLASNTPGCTSGLMGSFSCPSGNGWYSHSTSAGDWQQRTLNTCWARDRIQHFSASRLRPSIHAPSFFARDGRCGGDLKTPLARQVTFQGQKITELARRGEAWGTSEARQMLEYAIELGCTCA